MSCNPRRQRGDIFAFALLLLISAQLACNKKAENARPPRYAVLRFENLSGDPALDWTGRAISESMPVSLAGVLDGPVLGSSALKRLGPTLGQRPPSAPGISSERVEALIAGANRVITGYLSGAAGRIRITATEEDVSTGKSLRVVTASGISPAAALDQLAHKFSPHAGPFPTSNPEALRAWSIALDSPPAVSVDLLDRALHFDPDLGAAWVALASLDIGLGNRPAADDVMERARHRNLDDLSRANLEMLAASLREDRPARIAAMRKVSSLSPADSILLRSLAEAETAAGQFAAAASDWAKVTAAFPSDVLAWNSLGYARSWARDYTGALAALREYQRLRPKEPNPSDSIGDLNYSFGKFSEAAASYLDAHKKQPDFGQHGDLYKAAWAKFRAGDKAAADSVFSQFHAERLKARPSDEIIELFAGDWLYRTGRRREAIAVLRKLVSETSSEPVRSDAYAQVTIWDLLQGDRAQAAKDAAAIGPRIANSSVLMARFAALPSAPAAEWEMRAQRMIPPPMTPLRQMALGYALLLDGKREAALPVWKQIVDTNIATDLFARAVYARLQGKTPERPVLPNAVSLNQFSAVLDTL